MLLAEMTKKKINMKIVITSSLQNSVQLGLIQQLRMLCLDIFLFKSTARNRKKEKRKLAPVHLKMSIIQ